MAVITVWTDILCAWSYVAVARLFRARDHLGADVAVDVRAWPAELTGGTAPSKPAARIASAVLAQHDSRLFSSFDGSRWPGSSLPAFEAQKWAYAQSQETGESFDLALRRALFLHSRNVAASTDLVAVAAAEGLDAEELAAALGSGAFRKAVTDDVAAGQESDVEGTALVVLPDGTAHRNPGISYRDVRGIPVIESDHPGVYDDLIRAALSDD